MDKTSPFLKDTMKGFLIFFPLLLLSQLFGVTFMWTLVLVIIVLHYYKFISQSNQKKKINFAKYEKQVQLHFPFFIFYFLMLPKE